jgi:hypothetical protein
MNRGELLALAVAMMRNPGAYHPAPEAAAELEALSAAAQPLAWRAALETRNFDFEGVGASPAEAESALTRALAIHGRQYGLPDDWAADMGREECDARPISPGAFRDREPLND